ncbi:unnamed protein product [Arctia plantaginis]|uniref:Endonuclease/exonuclease/phosphatase domain-containing protein n=1 Tax=Arctia plantaginis TaxID=874455 RepID=A0A8S1AVD8_ARCPL|nr:unnamed protein product [Arctia plantaginis]
MSAAILTQNSGLLREIPEKQRSARVVRRVKGRTGERSTVVMECYRCLGFGHRATECQGRSPTCGYCSTTPEPVPEATQHPSAQTVGRGPATRHTPVNARSGGSGTEWPATQSAIAEGSQGHEVREPYVGATRKLEVLDARVFQGGAGTQPPKAAVVVLDDRLRVSQEPDCAAYNMVGVRISMGELCVGVVSVYLEGDSDLDEDLSKLRAIGATLHTDHCLIAGDVNARSPWWGCKDEDSRGASLAEFAAQESLQVINEGTTPTFSAFRQGREHISIIDVTMASVRLAPRITGWRVDSNLSDLSDHRPISFGVSTDGEPTALKFRIARVTE